MQLSDNESVQSDSESSEEDGFNIQMTQLNNSTNLRFSANKKEAHQPSFKQNMDLPNAIPISDQHYSLEPDMVFGWMPKIKFNGPINLIFKSLVNDQISDYLLQNDEFHLIYRGFRPNDTIRLHKQYSSPTTYPFKFENLLENQRMAHLLPLVLQQKANKTEPFIGMNEKYPSTIVFDSQFEGGNLDLVIQVNEFEYDLFMRVDSNTRGHLSWFNFKIKGLKQNIKLNICNFTKGKCLYTKGMRAFISINDGDWLQRGKNVTYKEQSLRYKWVEYNRRYFCLSFELEFTKLKDLFQIAYCVPYSYSKMLKVIKDLSNQPWCQQVKLCQDLSGINIPLLIVNHEDESLIPQEQRKVVIIQARIHPGESNGSWMMHGFLKFLETPQAKELKEKCILKIIPMVNPDGVIIGNYRTGSAGRDLNREFIKADIVLYPAVHAIKQLVADTYAKYGTNLIAFIDMHGHSVRKNVFTYGPEFSIWDPNYIKCRLLTKLLDNSTEMFRYYSSIFRVSEHKKSTARGVFCHLYGIVNCFTVEASNGFYYSPEQMKSLEFKAEDWTLMGILIGESLSQLVELILLYEKTSGQKVQKRQEGKFRNNSLIKVRRPTNQQKIRQSKLLSKPASSLNTLEPKQASVTDVIEDRIMAELEFNVENTVLKNLLNDVKNFENQRKQNQMDEDESEGRSDSESSQDDDDELVQQLRLQILKQTQPNSPDMPRQRRKSGKQKSLVQQRLKKPPLHHLIILQDFPKPETAKPQQMSFGMTGIKRPLPTIQNNLSDRQRSQEAKRNTSNIQKPAFQIITKSMNSGSTSHTIQTTQEPFHHINANMVESYVSHNQNIPLIQSTFSRPSTAQAEFILQDSIVNHSITSRPTTRFRSQPMLGVSDQSSQINQIKNGIVLNRAFNQFGEEKKSILEQQGFIQFMLQKHDQTINQDIGYLSLKTKIVSHPIENISVADQTSFQFQKQIHQSKLLMDNHRHKLEKDKQIKTVKQPFPSAFYNMKKHLFKKKIPQIGELPSSPMMIRAAPSTYSKR